ncbi:MAG: acyltransferase [Acidimicrobiales bacterium]|nr:acyltransferase [Acidimicrobiales bacterium]
MNASIHTGWNWVAKHGATGPGTSQAARFGAFGDGSCLAFPPGAIFGERWVAIGRDTLVGPYVSISAGMVPDQHMVTYPVVRIGDRCMIGRGSHIVGHFNIEIGDDVHTGPYVYITDQNHGYEDPDQVVHRQWPSDVPVRIGDGSWLGTGVVILPGTELGRNVVVGAGAVVRGTFPDHCVIAGVPARIIRRYLPTSGWMSGAAGSAAGSSNPGVAGVDRDGLPTGSIEGPTPSTSSAPSTVTAPSTPPVPSPPTAPSARRTTSTPAAPSSPVPASPSVPSGLSNGAADANAPGRPSP